MRTTLLLSIIIAICAGISQALIPAQGWEFLLFYTAWKTELASGVTPRIFAAQPHGISTTFEQFLLYVANKGESHNVQRLVESTNVFKTTAPNADRIASVLAKATKISDDGSIQDFQITTNLSSLFVHNPRGRNRWADALQNSASSLRLALNHDPRLLDAARSCAKFFENIYNIRFCDHSEFQITRLGNAKHQPNLPKNINIETKQGPLPGNDCRMIDYAATWHASPQLTNSDKEAIVAYMRPEAQGRDAREHLQVLSAAASGAVLLNHIIKDCSRKQARCVVM